MSDESDDEFNDDEFNGEASSAPDPDRELVAAWQEQGDKQAANRLLTRHLPSLRRYFRNKVGSRTDEEELLAQTLKGLVEAIPGFRRESSFRTFLFKLARNKLRDHFRAKSRKPDAVDIEELSVADLSPGPSTIRSRNRWDTLLLGGLRAISLSDQELLELRYWEKLTVPELIEFLGISGSAVKNRLLRAKERLRKAMATLAESNEELERVRTGEIDRWAEEVRPKHLGDRPGDGDDGDDGDDER
jgi:RNA polymerase sigma-70 factor (ECF subfamily)